MTLLELAAKVEAAEGPSFALDCEISKAVGSAAWPPRAYTASIDAAMMLVPDGCGWSAGWGQILPDKPMGEARITRNAHFIGYDANYDVIAKANAATPALALTAASLCARSENPA